MIFLFKRKPVLSTIILMLLTLLLSGYFLWQVLKGELSVFHMKGNKEQLNILVNQYENNNLDIKFYENRIKSLDPDSLNIDVLEEEMRKKMLFTKDSEILLLNSHTDMD